MLFDFSEKNKAYIRITEKEREDKGGENALMNLMPHSET